MLRWTYPTISMFIDVSLIRNISKTYNTYTEIQRYISI